MSKKIRPFLFVLAASIQILQIFTLSEAQDLDVRISMDEKTPASIRVEGRFLLAERPNRQNLIFLRDHAGTSGLAERFTSVELLGSGGAPLQFRKLIAGEYLADGNIDSWTYGVSLAPTGRPSSYAHVSWLGPDRGILMMGDLMPQIAGSSPVASRVFITLPAGWETQTTERRASDGSFDVADIDKAVFVVSRRGSFRKLNARIGSPQVIVFDNWLFGDSDASAMAAEIAGGYTKVFGAPAPADALVTIMRFPGDVKTGAWEADTRGGSVTILSSDMPFKSQSLQRLHEQLRHEMFHLWIPNGVNLSGKYDWFYEGFALYQSLKFGVASNRIRFDDYLAALSQAFVIDNIQPQRISLIEASKQRWAGANTQVYARGMLTAFLCDIAMLRNSRGKLSVDDLLRDVYRRFHATPNRLDGNQAILELMREREELRPVVDAYVTGSNKIDGGAEMLAAGIDRINDNSLPNLKVVPKPDRRQRDLLDRLGYNNWRKLSEGTK